jgi:hypothetical protein
MAKKIKPLTAVIFSIFLFGCNNEEPLNEKKLSTSNGWDVLTVLTMDNCEYVVYNGYQKGGITHHAGCHNPIHGFYKDSMMQKK